MKNKQPRSRRSAAVGEIYLFGGSSLGRGPRFADDAVDGLGGFGSDRKPFIGAGEIDGEIGAFLERIVGTDLFDVAAIATLAAVDGYDFVIRAGFGALAVEAERYGHGRLRLRLPGSGRARRLESLRGLAKRNLDGMRKFLWGRG